ncbi:MAG: hypothetical protein CL840_14360 [Crocinitomicaceae bacterium]|nr:hypothetical protein [Crocinitomicaceae bacterium]|tara:strand:+ start:5119 stop:6795 length:1677 start_codon:yes stop_codon:yes gene_type:complete
MTTTLKTIGLLLGLLVVVPILKSQPGPCLRFNGSNEYVRVNHNSDFNVTSTWTIEFWLNPDVTPSGWDAVISKNVSDRPPGVWLYYNSVEVWYGTGTNGLIAYTNYGTISAGEWQHVAVTRSSGNSVKIYINGELEATFNSTSTPPTNSSRLNFAQRGDGSYYYDGYLDDIRYWSDERTQSEIRDNMCKQLTGSEAGLISYWRFDKGSGSTATDFASAHNGSLRNTPTWDTSGAPIGTSSSSLYTSSWSGKTLYHTSSDGDSLRVSSVTGSPDGIIIYSVDKTPNYTSGTAGLGGNDHYFGVFKANGSSPTYTMTYYYGNNSAFKVGGGATETDLKIYQRTNNASSSWSTTSTTLNTGSQTLTATGLNSQFILGSSGNALPVDLLKFEGEKSPNGNELYWVTSSETNSDYFLIERSPDGNEWEYLKTVDGAGTKNDITKYHITDYFPWEYTYYRLTQFDLDGQKEVYDVILVDNTSPNSNFRSFEVFPTAAIQDVNIKSTENGKVEIRSTNGQLVYTNSMETGALKVNIEDFPAGSYLVTLIPENEKSRTIRFVKIAQ